MKIAWTRLSRLLAVSLSLAAAPLLAGTEGSSSTFYGQNVGSLSDPTSGSNAFVGAYAGNVAGLVSNSTYIGYQSGVYGSGNANTYLGARSGFSSPSAPGSDNTFVGVDTGFFNYDGHVNTFVGKSAGYTNTAGYANTFLGTEAGYSNTNGYVNTFVGKDAGYFNTQGYQNTFLGYYSGHDNSSGARNTFVGEESGKNNSTGTDNASFGMQAGFSNTTGIYNTALGRTAGYTNSTGNRNVFVGYGAGYSETGSNRLYIDNCLVTFCGSPFIYGEFDNHLLNINGVTNVAANGVAKSQMHFSLANADSGGFLTSVLPNNFFVSSGARFDSGNWMQLSADGNAVMAGSGGVGYRIFTHSGGTVGTSFTPTLRLHIDYSGQFGINTAPVAGHEIHTLTGAYEMAGSWVDASSRDLKDNIVSLTNEDAARALAELNPVRYNYKVTPDEVHVGFIAEDVPELVARKDRKGLAPMDIVAVLTKVVQEKAGIIDRQTLLLQRQQEALEQLQSKVRALEQRAGAER